MSRFKKFLYAYFSIILGLVVLSILGVETWSDKTPIELFLCLINFGICKPILGHHFYCQI